MTTDATTGTALPVERERYLTPREVAELFRVDPKTVTRWATQGLSHVRALLTP